MVLVYQSAMLVHFTMFAPKYKTQIHGVGERPRFHDNHIGYGILPIGVRLVSF